MRTVSIKLPEKELGRLAAIARRRGTTVSHVVREAIEAYEGGVTGSFRELAADLEGSVAGPRDLSTNRKHPEGFGK